MEGADGDHVLAEGGLRRKGGPWLLVALRGLSWKGGMQGGVEWLRWLLGYADRGVLRKILGWGDDETGIHVSGGVVEYG